MVRRPARSDRRSSELATPSQQPSGSAPIMYPPQRADELRDDVAEDGSGQAQQLRR